MPLTAIKTLARTLQRGKEDESQRQEFLQEIVAACDREISLVQNLVDLLRIEVDVLRTVEKRVDIPEVISSLSIYLQPAAARRGINLQNNVPDGLADVRADYSTLRRALGILLEKAIEENVNNSEIFITCEPVLCTPIKQLVAALTKPQICHSLTGGKFPFINLVQSSTTAPAAVVVLL